MNCDSRIQLVMNKVQDNGHDNGDELRTPKIAL